MRRCSTLVVLSALAAAGCGRDLDLPAPPGKSSGSSQTGGASSSDGTRGSGGSASPGSVSVGGAGGDGPVTTDVAGGGSAGSNDAGAPSLVAARIGPIELDEDQEPYVIVLDGFDEEHAARSLDVTVGQLPSLGTLTQQSGHAPLSVSYELKPDAFGSDSFTFYVSDSQGNRSPNRKVSIEIRSVNDAPVAKADTARTDSLSAVEIPVLDNDRDVDDAASELTVVAHAPQHGAVELMEDQSVRYIPPHPWSGVDIFTYTASDPAGLSDTATVRVEVSEGFPNPSDWDGDGISNDDEARLGTDPKDTDSDDDGVPDGVEDANHDGVIDSGESNPLDPDTDGDGRCDGLRTDNDGDKDDDGDPLDPKDGCLGPVLVDVDNETDTQDGLTWATAFDEVQKGLDLANGKRQVWVAEGRYTPDAPRARVAQLVPGAELYGGFRGSETHLEARDLSLHITLLDGDYAQDDTDGVTVNRSDNSEQVVELSGAGILNGLSIRNGEKRVDGGRLGAGVVVRAPGVLLENLELSRNVSRFDGGAVGCKEDCQITVRNAAFEDNHALAGGGIYVSADADGGLLSLEDSRFTGNSAAGQGGAVYVDGSIDLTLVGASFESNQSGDDGGALYAGGGETTLLDSQFVDNEAVDNGGGVFNAGVLHADGTSFEDNRAAYGGGLSNRGEPGKTDVFLTDVSMTGNSVSAEGGALYSIDTHAEIRGSEFSQNHAVRFGGAILQYSDTLVIEQSSLSENIADATAGAIRCYRADCGIQATSFVGNQAVQRAGGFEQWYGEATLSDVVFEGNTASNEGATWGGGAYCQSAECSLDKAKFSSNAAYYGAGLYCTSAECSMLDTSFTSNLASFSGGGLYCYSSTCEIEASEFESNTSSQYAGGATCAVDSNCQFGGSSFESNAADVGGGGIYCQSSSCDFADTSFELNKARYGAGVVCNVQADCSFESTSFSFNQAAGSGDSDLSRSGGGLYCQASACEVEASTFAYNEATRSATGPGGGYGAGMYCFSADCLLSDAVFTGNRATNSGGALYDQLGAAYAERTVFLRNTAGVGGAVFEFTGALSTRGVAFVSNSATWSGSKGRGGAIHSSLSRIDVRDSTFFANTADLGGATHHRDDPDIESEYPVSEVTFTGVTFAHNEANEDGGAIQNTLAVSPTLTNVALLENVAARGGAIFGELGAHPVLTNVSLFENRAGTEGGALYNTAEASSTVLNSIFFGNISASTASDLVDLSSTPSLVRYVRSEQPLVGDNTASIALDPFFHDGFLRLFLDQALTSADGGVDAGSNQLADDADFGFSAVGSADWTALTTSSDGALDQGPVDLGRHYDPQAVAIVEFSVSETELLWSVENPRECLWFNSVSSEFARLDTSGSEALASGRTAHGRERDTEITLVCFGDAGEPSVATGTVP